MIMGYDDSGRRPKLCHMPLSQLIGAHADRPLLDDPHKHLNWGKRNPAGGCLSNWPRSLTTGNGHRPFD